MKHKHVRLPLPSSVELTDFVALAAGVCRDLGLHEFGDYESSIADNATICSRVSAERVLGGITNELVKLTPTQPVGTRNCSSAYSVIVRVFGPASELVIDREAEKQVVEQMTKFGIGAEVLGTFENGRVERFISDTRVLCYEDIYLGDENSHGNCHDESPRINVAVIRGITRLLRNFHQANIITKDGPHETTCSELWRTMYKFHQLAKTFERESNSLGNSHTMIAVDLSTVYSEIEELQSRCEKFDTFETVFTHNDLLMGNFLLSQPERDLNNPTMYLIDFEYSCYGHLCYDFANMFNEFAGFECLWHKVPTKQVMKIFFKHYFNSDIRDCIRNSKGVPTDNEKGSPHDKLLPLNIEEKIEVAIHEVEIYKLVSHLFWCLWSLIQAKTSKINFDYGNYAIRRYQRYWIEKEMVLSKQYLQ